jgi:hypothetical protein
MFHHARISFVKLSIVNSVGALALIGLFAGENAVARVGEGWVVRVRQSGNESRLGIQGFTLESSLDSEHRTFKIRARSPGAVQSFVAFNRGRHDSDSRDIAKMLSEMTDVEFAEPNFLYRSSSGARRPQSFRDDLNSDPPPDIHFSEVIPSDPYFQTLWGLRNRGQSVARVQGISGADTHATGAWVFEKGSEQVIVGVLDTGIDLQHEDLKENLWTASSAGGPIHGFNTFNSAADPQDDNGHGTHVSGTIGAVGDNGLGVVGINWKVSLMAVKVLNKDGEGDLAGIVEGIDWAVDHGARVINASWGGPDFSQIMRDSIARASQAGVLFVAAAGNEAENNDQVGSYPANYEEPNVLSVAATDNRDRLAEFSNYGTSRVDLAAPGVGIYSTLPGNHYGAESGTSMATPHVTGAAALLLSRSPNLSVNELRSKILESADHLNGLKSKIGNNGARLNLLKLVK